MKIVEEIKDEIENNIDRELLGIIELYGGKGFYLEEIEIGIGWGEEIGDEEDKKKRKDDEMRKGNGVRGFKIIDEGGEKNRRKESIEGWCKKGIDEGKRRKIRRREVEWIGDEKDCREENIGKGS